MSDVKKSALWALISIPISLTGHYYLIEMLIAEADTFFFLPFLPAVIAIAGLGNLETPMWVINSAALTAQYLGYFLFAYLTLKIIRAWKKTDEPSPAREASDKDLSNPPL